MQYTILVYETEAELAARTDAKRKDAYWGAYQLGGYYVIDVPSLEKALEWAARCPSAATGAAEVRPNMPPPPPA